MYLRIIFLSFAKYLILLYTNKSPYLSLPQKAHLNANVSPQKGGLMFFLFIFGIYVLFFVLLLNK